MNTSIVIMLAVMCLLTLTTLIVLLRLFRPWLQCFLSGVPVPLFEIVAMQLRQSPVKLICEQRIRANHVGVNLSCSELEQAHLKGVDIEQAVDALCLAQRTDQDVGWEDLVATYRR